MGCIGGAIIGAIIGLIGWGIRAAIASQQPRMDLADTGGGCPACGSMQVDVTGGRIVCYACDEVTPL